MTLGCGVGELHALLAWRSLLPTPLPIDQDIVSIPTAHLPFPDTMNLALAMQAAAAGAEVVQRYSGEMHAADARAKSPDAKSYDLVTNADLESEAAIAQVIQAGVPSGEKHEILGEETHAGDVTADHLWVVDPLDGTNNFAHQVPHYASSAPQTC